jgi:predicted AlkP superfamily pyrophosphatase or phosphodiesterase
MKFTILIISILFTFNLWSAEILNNVVIISIDALHPDAVTRENAPNIMSLADKGVITLKGMSTIPPKTLISHSAMFTGKTPQNGGRKSNKWKKGEPSVQGETIMDLAKRMGYQTGYFYSKGKLGFLATDSIDKVVFSREDSIEKTIEYMNTQGKKFIFLHVSGLDFTGPDYGWMSKEYIEDFNFIDEQLKPLFDRVMKNKRFLIVVTSDHAGHDKEHGCDHDDDYKLPFIAVSDLLSVESEILQNYETYKLISYLRDISAIN